MWRFIQKILLLLSLTAAARCAEKEDMAGVTPVQLEASIADALSDGTRTSMSESKASFTSGDNIGLFETLTGQSNVSYSLSGSTWSSSSPAYWLNATSTHTFYAYYPYKSGASGTVVPIPTLSTQTVGTTPSPAADFLVAGPVSQTRSSGVNLTFTHGFALLQFNVKLGVLGLLNAYNINNVTINAGNLSTSSSPYGIVNKTANASDLGYNVVTQTLQYSDNSSVRFSQTFVGALTNITVLYTAVTIYVFVLPGNYTSPAPTVTFNLSLLGILLPVDTKPVALSNTPFQARTKYSYDVSIRGLLLAPEITPTVTIVPQKPILIDDTI